ncbi:MAG: cytochrome c5 family protein [Gammaproteobacteria bacterium]
MHQRHLIVLLTLAGLLGACGDDKGQGSATSAAPAPAAPPVADTAPAAPATPAPTPSAPAEAAAAAPDEHGKSVYNKTCALCHAAGVAGAPMPGNKVDWGPRIAQGKDTLYQHAIEGYTGQNGMMPPRGGNAALSDEEMKSAVDYMVAKSM